MYEIDNCPKCNGTAALKDRMPGYVWVECSECFYRGETYEASKVDKAINTWNIAAASEYYLACANRLDELVNYIDDNRELFNNVNGNESTAEQYLYALWLGGGCIEASTRTSCAYCGSSFSNTDTEAIHHHIHNCPSHPIAEYRLIIEALEVDNQRYRDIIGNLHLRTELKGTLRGDYDTLVSGIAKVVLLATRDAAAQRIYSSVFPPPSPLHTLKTQCEHNHIVGTADKIKDLLYPYFHTLFYKLKEEEELKDASE